MSYSIDFTTATSTQIERALCERLESIRLSRNLSQARLAEEAQISERTLRRMVKGQGVSVDTFLRVLIALDVQQNLEALLPDPSVRPIERVKRHGQQRQRAGRQPLKEKAASFTWDDGEDEDEDEDEDDDA